MTRPKDLSLEHTWRLRQRRQAASGLSISALPRTGTPHNDFLGASNHPDVAGARIAGVGNVDAERGEKADVSANGRGRSLG
jgi:hypothetical protein